MDQTDWTPEFTYLGRRSEAPTTWAQPLDREGNRYSHDSAALLVEAELGIEEIEFITQLRLDPEQHIETKCAHFTELMGTLPRIMEHDNQGGTSCFRILPGMRWIRELVAGFIPDRPVQMNQPGQNPATWLVNNGHGPALTILHLLLMRSNYWRWALAGGAATDAEGLAYLWDTTPEDAFSTLYMLAGDPFNLPPHTGEWELGTFQQRYRVFELARTSVQPFLGDLDLLARVAGSSHSELGRYLEAYSGWRAVN